jgi:glycosyltransferase involved in cell wall biosynthesis
MTSKRYSLAIVQTHATQTEGPLFAQLAKNPDIELTVYYTKPRGEATFDGEIGINPDWGSRVITGYRYRTRKTGFLEAMRLMHAIGKGRHDLIVIAGYLPFYHTLIALYLRLSGTPIGLRSDTTLLYGESAKRIKLLLKKMLPCLFKLYHLGHPTGSPAREYLLKHGFREQQLFRFPYAVDNDYLAARCDRYRIRRDRIRQAMNIGPDAFVVLGVVKLVEREDPMTLVLGFARLLEIYPNAHLVLVGDGPMMKDIKNTISEKSLSNVHLPGFVKYHRLPLFYGIADVFVHTATREPWGVSVNEAMACGVPVVVANTVGSHIDLVRKGKTGFVFTVRNHAELAIYLQQLASNSALRKEMSVNCLSLIQDWNYDYVEKSLLGAIATIKDRAHERIILQ